MSLVIIVLPVTRIKTPQKLGGSGGEFFRDGSIRNGRAAGMMQCEVYINFNLLQVFNSTLSHSL